MLGNTMTSSIALLGPGAKADTSAATGAYISIANYEGHVCIVSNCGTVTAGSVAGKIQHADDDSGTNVADVTGATFVTVTTSNDPKCEELKIKVDGLKPYIRYVGTVTTGPVDLGVTLTGNPKYV